MADPRRIIYNLTRPAMAARRAGVRRRGLPMRVLHIVALLDEACAVAERGA